MESLARVLVVEDEPAIRMFLVDALQDEGYEVMPAANGVQALELLAAEQWRPDVILLDMLMPAMDGAAFAEAYRRSAEPHAPIVVVTAFRSQEARATAAGADDVLIKPVELNDLLSQVARHVQARQPTGPPPLTTITAAVLVIAALLGAVAASPVLAQSHSQPSASVVPAAAAQVETSSVMVNAKGAAVRVFADSSAGVAKASVR